MCRKYFLFFIICLALFQVKWVCEQVCFILIRHIIEDQLNCTLPYAHLSFDRGGVVLHSGSVIYHDERLSFDELALSMYWDHQLHVCIDLKGGRGILPLVSMDLPPSWMDISMRAEECVFRIHDQECSLRGNFFQGHDEAYAVTSLQDDRATLYWYENQEGCKLKIALDHFDITPFSRMLPGIERVEGSIVGELCWVSEGERLGWRLLGNLACDDIRISGWDMGAHIQALRSAFSLDSHFIWNGELEIQHGRVFPFGQEGSLWDLNMERAALCVKENQLYCSDVKACFLGLTGVMKSDFGTNKQILFLCDGTLQELFERVPFPILDPWRTEFAHCPIKLSMQITPTFHAIDLVGELSIDHLYHISFGTQLGQSILLEPDLAKLPELVEQLFEPIQGYKGWIRAYGIPLEKFLNPVVSPKGIQTSGVCNIEGLFNEQYLMLFYDSPCITIGTGASSFSYTVDRTQRGIQYVNWHTLEYIGFTPFHQGTYQNDQQQYTLEQGKGILHYEHQHIAIKDLTFQYNQYTLEGCVEVILGEMIDLRITCSQGYGEFSRIAPLYKGFSFPEDLSGTLLLERGYLHYLGKELVEGFIEGSLEDVAYPQLYHLSAHMHFFYDLHAQHFVCTEGECRFLTSSGAFYTLGIPTFSCDPKEGIIETVLSLTHDHHPRMEVHVKIRGDSTYREITLTGKTFEAEGFQQGEVFIFEHLRWLDWNGSLRAIRGEEVLRIDHAIMQHPHLGKIQGEGWFQYATGLFYGTIEPSQISLPHIEKYASYVQDVECCISGEFCWDCLMGEAQGNLSLQVQKCQWKEMTLTQLEAVPCFFDTKQGLWIDHISLSSIHYPCDINIDSVFWSFSDTQWNMEHCTFRSTKEGVLRLFPLSIGSYWDDGVVYLEGSLRHTTEGISGVFLMNPQSVSISQHPMLIHGISLLIDQTHLYLYGTACVAHQHIDFSLHTQVASRMVGEIIIIDPMHRQQCVTIQWQYQDSFLWDTVHGTIFNSEIHLEREGHLLKGRIRCDLAALTVLLPLGGFEHLQLKGHMTAEGKLIMGEDLQYQGEVYIHELRLYNTMISHVKASLNMNMNECVISQLTVEDGSGFLTVDDLHVFRVQEQWNFFVHQVMLQDYHLGKMRSAYARSYTAKPFLKSLYIKACILRECFGSFADPSSIVGYGEIHFSHRAQKSFVSNLLAVPTEIRGRIGLDLTSFVPQEGSIRYEIAERRIYLRQFKNVFSENKRSRFFLVDKTPSYIGFDGNLHVKVKIKHYNLLMKFTELFLFNIKGTWDKPSCTLTSDG